MLNSWLFFACVGKLVKNAMIEKKISCSLRRYPNSNATPWQQVSHTCISTPTLPGSNKWPFQPQANEDKRTRLEALGQPSVHPWQIEHQQLGCQIVKICIFIFTTKTHNAKHFWCLLCLPVQPSRMPKAPFVIVIPKYTQYLMKRTVKDWKHLFTTLHFRPILQPFLGSLCHPLTVVGPESTKSLRSSSRRWTACFVAGCESPSTWIQVSWKATWNESQLLFVAFFRSYLPPGS